MQVFMFRSHRCVKLELIELLDQIDEAWCWCNAMSSGGEDSMSGIG